MFRKCVVALVLVAPAINTVAAETVMDRIGRYIVGQSAPDAQVSDLFKQYQVSPNAAVLGKLQVLAKNPDAPIAKNVIGCIYFNSLGVSKNTALATQYFLEASKGDPVAAGNYGLALLRAGNAKGYTVLRDAFQRSALEIQGVQLLLAQAHMGRVDQRLFERLLARKNPVALYYRAYLDYYKQDYSVALKAALDAAEFGSTNAPFIVSKSYLALYSADQNPLNKENAEIWGAIDVLIKARQDSIPSDEADPAYRKARMWLSNHRMDTTDYNQAVCLNPGVVI